MTPPEGQVGIVPYGAVHQFVAVAKRLLLEKDVYRRFSEGEKSWVLQYSKERVLERFLQLIFPKS